MRFVQGWRIRSIHSPQGPTGEQPPCPIEGIIVTPLYLPIPANAMLWPLLFCVKLLYTQDALYSLHHPISMDGG